MRGYARSLKLLAKMGLADRLIGIGKRTMRINLYVNGRRIVNIKFDDFGIDETPYPFIYPLYILFSSQVETERILEQYLAAKGIEVVVPYDWPVCH